MDIYYTHKKEIIKRLNLTPYIVLIIMSVSVLLGLIYINSLYVGNQNNCSVNVKYVGLDTLSFSEENLLKVMEFHKITAIDTVLAQSKVETAHYTSKVFIENHNAFGFRVFPLKWDGVQMAFKNRGHLVFSHWTKSVEQYKLFQDANFKGGNYISFLRRQQYAEDQNYYDLITKIK